MINLKIMEQDGHRIVNLCDSNLIGARIGEVVISEYYYGIESTRDEIISALTQATLINALGEESVSIVKEVRGNMRTSLLGNHPFIFFVKI